VTDSQHLGNYRGKHSANVFFQNNNLILAPLIPYVRDAVFAAGKKGE
jgi:hypothetical protein